MGPRPTAPPVIAGGKVYVGTNNGGKLRQESKVTRAVLVCLDEQTGKFLWQATHDKLPSGSINDWPEQGIVSGPWVQGDRLYYVSNECQLVCADVEGFLDGENDGPFLKEKYHEQQDADFIWVLDMYHDLHVFPHNLATCSPVGWEDLIFATTSNGVDDSHRKMPHPEAPDIIAVDKQTGKVIWQRNDAGPNVFHGQWSSPALGDRAGETATDRRRRGTGGATRMNRAPASPSGSSTSTRLGRSGSHTVRAPRAASSAPRGLR